MGKNNAKSKAMRKAIDNPDFLAWVCPYHNAVTKTADKRWARKVFVLNRCEYFGEDYMRDLINGLPWKYPPYDLSFAGIMAVEIPIG